MLQRRDVSRRLTKLEDLSAPSAELPSATCFKGGIVAKLQANETYNLFKLLCEF